MSPDLVVRVTARTLTRGQARRIADAAWPPDALSVRARSYRLPQWLGRDGGQGELLLGAHDILDDQADWSAETWLFDPQEVPRFVSTLTRLLELFPEEFELLAAWVGDDARRRERVTRDELLAVVSANSLGNRVVYQVGGA